MFRGSETKAFRPMTSTRSIAQGDVFFSPTFQLTQRKWKLVDTKTQMTFLKPIQYLAAFRKDIVLSIANRSFPRFSFRFHFTLCPCLSSARALQCLILCSNVSALPQVQMNRSCPCRRYGHIKFMCPMHNIVMQICLR